MKLTHTLLALFTTLTATLTAQNLYTHATHPDIKTLQIKTTDSQQLTRPILELNSDAQITISFDELSHEARYYTYTITHCNADWTPSDLMTNEYISGYTTSDIDQYELSYNTQQIYTHYQLTLPNDDMQLTASGNYAVRIYEDGDMEHTVAWACFSVVDPKLFIDANVRSNTDIELNGRYQQVDIDIETAGHDIRDPFSEVKVVVRQNGRHDNQVLLTRPTFVERSRLRYINNRSLIFEGGNEYRSFDILSEYILGEGVDRVEFDNTHYHATLFTSEITTDGYVSNQDANGQYIINRERSDYSDTEADYMWVHFTLPMRTPFFDGGIYVGGDLTYNYIAPDTRMTYDNQTQQYTYSQYLKQGGYNFQYWFVPKGSAQGSTQRTDGSYWEAQNEYAIYVYHRPFGQRYDQLIGYQTILAH